MTDCLRREAPVRPRFYMAIVAGMLGVGVSGRSEPVPEATQGAAASTPQALFMNYQEFKWEKILRDLGESSPEICILGVDPRTQATKLMIRAPKGIHVRKHWHSANETHTVILGRQTFACE